MDKTFFLMQYKLNTYNRTNNIYSSLFIYTPLILFHTNVTAIIITIIFEKKIKFDKMNFL